MKKHAFISGPELSSQSRVTAFWFDVFPSYHFSISLEKISYYSL